MTKKYLAATDPAYAGRDGKPLQADGRHDDTAALRNALKAAAAQNACVALPNGRIKLTGVITVSPK